ncbi:Cytochrome P450 76C2 [Dichanthelium oligosanthes]|uniref:Cytochrome P450 76C2 n=1 Tax=Dichanthelium oligosanthes TaxID=888268 RepID=A0A1E5VZS5_9POAL|nr:Cytochrome P450 76C2 [Dichanthelium oligosanthes]
MVHFLVAVVVVVEFIYSFQLITGAGRRRRLPPGPWPFPIIGSFPAVAWSSRPHRSLARLAERYGPLMSIWAGPYATVVVSAPDAAREILLRHNADLAGRTVLDAWRTEGHAARSVIFLPPHDRWRAMRRLASAELFAQRRLDPRRQEKAREMVRHVSGRAARGGESVDVGEAVFAATMDMLSRTLFSVDLGHHGLRHMVRAASQLSGTPTISDVFLAVAAADIQGVRAYIG